MKGLIQQKFGSVNPNIIRLFSSRKEQLFQSFFKFIVLRGSEKSDL